MKVSSLIRVSAAALILSSPSLSFSQARAEDDKPRSEKRRTVVIKYEPKYVETSKVIPLRTVSFETVKRICEPLLSKKGTIAHLPERSSVIVFDTREVVEKIAGLIAKIDKPAVNIRVDVDFIGSGTSRRDRLNVKFGNKKTPRINNRFIIRNGKLAPINRVEISGVVGRGSSTRNTSQFIVTKSGHPASIWAGRRIADPTWLRHHKLRPTIIVPVGGGGAIVVPGSDNEFVWSDVGASLQVLPKALGNGLIEVEVYPVVSYLVDEPESGRRSARRGRRRRPRRQSVKVEDVSTKVTVRSGQRISIGSIINSHKDFYTNLFGPDFLSRDENNSILDMYLTATILEPGSSGRRGYIPRTR